MKTEHVTQHKGKPVDLGAASLDIKLSKGIITITGPDGETLKKFYAAPGSWFKLWDTVEEIHADCVADLMPNI